MAYALREDEDLEMFRIRMFMKLMDRPNEGENRDMALKEDVRSVTDRSVRNWILRRSKWG